MSFFSHNATGQNKRLSRKHRTRNKQGIPKEEVSPFHSEVLGFTQRQKWMKIKIMCLEAIQEATELYLLQLLDDAWHWAFQRNCVTINPMNKVFERHWWGSEVVGNKQQKSYNYFIIFIELYLLIAFQS